MRDARAELLKDLEGHYRSCGWKTRRRNGTVEATGPSGVTWIGRGVTADELGSEAFNAELIELSQRRMPESGELCPAAAA